MKYYIILALICVSAGKKLHFIDDEDILSVSEMNELVESDEQTEMRISGEFQEAFDSAMMDKPKVVKANSEKK